MKERYEQLRHRLLAWGGFHPDAKMNCLQILEQMSPKLKCGLDPHLYLALELIEDQKLYIKHLSNLKQ